MNRRQLLLAGVAASIVPFKAYAEPREYRVSTETFRKQATGEDFSARIAEAIDQLVRRFNIRSQSIVSLGSRFGREEYFFMRHGNRMTMIDIDEPNPEGQIEPLLKTANPGELRYFIGDANEVRLPEPFDILFMSGFGPDDLRRRAIMKNGKWPADADPFASMVMRYADQLKPGGLMINQSITGGPDIPSRPDFLPACDRQLARHGMKLIELYRYSGTGNNLFIVSKGERPKPTPPPITVFHGRGEFADRNVEALRLT
jgi:hypothetical protein